LIEGCYLRSGLLSDVPLYEQSPGSYLADVRRRTRWIRGDWQLAGWLLPHVLDHSGTQTVNPLTTLSQWKLLDNLRRSLVPAAATTLLVIGWALVPQALAWTLWLLSLLLLPVLVPTLRDVFTRPMDMALETHLLQVLKSCGRQLQRAAVNLACLPYEMYFSLGAIVRTLWRMAISRRHLLQWNPSSEVERNLGSGCGAELRGMWFAPVAAIATAALLVKTNPMALWVATPILALWFVSPALMATDTFLRMPNSGFTNVIRCSPAESWMFI
jgi:hypothetical protein